MDLFHEKLKALNESIAKDFTDEGDEGSPAVQVYAPDYVDLNYPWLYIRFGLDGPLSLWTLKEIEKRYLAFCALEGGSLEAIHLNRRGPGFMVKMIYVGDKVYTGDKKKAPAEEQGPEEKPAWDSTAECSCVNGCKSYYCDKL